jgi:hypothetical protein
MHPDLSCPYVLLLSHQAMKQQGPFYLVGRNTSAAYGSGARGGHRGVGGGGIGGGRGGYVARGGAAVGGRGGHSSVRGGGGMHGAHGGDAHQSQDARAGAAPGDEDDGEWTSVGRAGRVVVAATAAADGGSRWTSSSRGGGQQQNDSRFTRNGSAEADAPKWQRGGSGAANDAGADDGATKTWRSSRLQATRKQEPR